MDVVGRTGGIWNTWTFLLEMLRDFRPHRWILIAWTMRMQTEVGKFELSRTSLERFKGNNDDDDD